MSLKSGLFITLFQCIRVLEGADVGVMWSNVVEETGEPGENHRTWTGDHYPATCLDPDSNPDRRGDKRVRYPLRYPGPKVKFSTLTVGAFGLSGLSNVLRT